MKQKGNKTEVGQDAQLFIKLFALSGLESNYDLYRLQSYGSSGFESFKAPKPKNENLHFNVR